MTDSLALVLLDFQQGMCAADGIVGRSGLAEQIEERHVLANAARALSRARDLGLRVVFVRLAFDATFANRTNATSRFCDHEASGRFVVGSTEARPVSELRARAGDLEFAKGSVGAFASTSLESVFRARGVDRLVLAGVATHLAVESTAREAADRGFAVTVLDDACASPSQELHEHAIHGTIPAFATVMSTENYFSGLRLR